MAVFCDGDEENGHHACLDGHLTTAYNPGMRLMTLPVIDISKERDLCFLSKIIIYFHIIVKKLNISSKSVPNKSMFSLLLIRGFDFVLNKKERQGRAWKWETFEYV